MCFCENELGGGCHGKWKGVPEIKKGEKANKLSDKEFIS
jgi:hypothetical protein